MGDDWCKPEDGASPANLWRGALAAPAEDWDVGSREACTRVCRKNRRSSSSMKMASRQRYAAFSGQGLSEASPHGLHLLAGPGYAAWASRTGRRFCQNLTTDPQISPQKFRQLAREFFGKFAGREEGAGCGCEWEPEVRRLIVFHVSRAVLSATRASIRISSMLACALFRIALTSWSGFMREILTAGIHCNPIFPFHIQNLPMGSSPHGGPSAFRLGSGNGGRHAETG